jgi:hypothetical protein
VVHHHGVGAGAGIHVAAPAAGITDVNGDYFGYSVAISGSNIVVGAYQQKIGSNASQGAAYVFSGDSSGGWQQTAELTASDGACKRLFR